MVALPSQPCMSSSSFYQAKMPPRSTKINNLHLAVVWLEREFSNDEWQVFALKKSELHLCSQKDKLYSLVLSESIGWIFCTICWFHLT